MKISKDMIRRRIVTEVEIAIIKNQTRHQIEKIKSEYFGYYLFEIKAQQIYQLSQFTIDALRSSLVYKEADKKGKAFCINMGGSNAPL